MQVLITGATGFLGKSIITRLVDDDRVQKIFVLVRPDSRHTAVERFEKMLCSIFPQSKQKYAIAKFRVFDGDLKKEGLGLSRESREFLVNNTNQILHIGASTDFGAPIDVSRESNVEGTRKILDFAAQAYNAGVLKRLDYISTAYVAGCKRGVVFESDLDRQQAFSNNYEKSKFEAELLVRQKAREIPTTIHRPSIVVGDSVSGFTPHFKVLYWPLKILAKGLLPVFPVNKRARLDVVPVDFVAKSIIEIMFADETLHQTYHITAGKGNEVRIKQLLTDASELAKLKKNQTIPFWAFDFIRLTPLRRILPEGFWQTVELAKPYRDYLRGAGVQFDATKTHDFLRRKGVGVPYWPDYKKEVLSFCSLSRWGKKLPLPEYVYYLPLSSRESLDSANSIRFSAR